MLRACMCVCVCFGVNEEGKAAIFNRLGGWETLSLLQREQDGNFLGGGFTEEDER